MSRFLSKRLACLEAYVPGEQPRDRRYLKLNTNESPYRPSPAVMAAAADASVRLNLYCDPTAQRLRAAAARVFGVAPECVLPVNGSDEILNFAFLAFCDGDTPVAYPALSYGFYRVLADLHGIKRREIPLRSGFIVDYHDYLGLNCPIVIANPNAPTGLAIGSREIEEILRSNPEHPVIIDEAYVDFGAESSLRLLKKYDNLLVTRTFSKSHSLAGARLGFGVGSPELIADVTAVKDSTNPYNVNAMTQAAGEAAFADNEYYVSNCRTVARTRDKTAGMLRELGFEVTDSAANFLFIRHGKVTGPELYTALRDRGILVRHFDREDIMDYNRVTVGTEEQMSRLCEAVAEIVRGGEIASEGELC